MSKRREEKTKSPASGKEAGQEEIRDAGRERDERQEGPSVIFAILRFFFSAINERRWLHAFVSGPALKQHKNAPAIAEAF